MRTTTTVAIIGVVLLAAAVGFILQGTGDSNRPTVTAYVAHDDVLSGPILEAFERETGIRVRAVLDTEATKTTGLVNKLMAMRDRPEAALFWNNEIMNTILLEREGLLAPYDSPSAVDIPEAFKDPDGYWVGFGVRARVILYNTDLVGEEEAPDSILDFLDPEWNGRFAVALPLFGTTATHAAVLYAALGPEEAERILGGWVENGAHVAAGNGMARDLVADGRIAACLTDTDDANGALMDGKPVRMVYPDQGEGEMGALVIPNTVMLIRNGPDPDLARWLYDYIASREVEAELARRKGAQMPLRAGIAPHSDWFDFTRVRAIEVDWDRAADMRERARAFVEEHYRR